jgi:agmatine deiminase
MEDSPVTAGFHMPAEWELQTAIWFTWPHDSSRWYGQFDAIPRFFAGMVSLASRYQAVHLIIPAGWKEQIRALLQSEKAILERIHYFEIATNDVWCRDSGPTFVRNSSTGEVAIVDWEYNSWGGKFPPWDKDNAIPSALAERLKMRRWKSPLIAEGGALEVNGTGVLMTTPQVLLNPNRNPQWTRQGIEQHLRSYLGVRDILWLPGGLEGDDTDGHIDNLARFVSADTVVHVVEDNTKDPNYAPLQENSRVLSEFVDWQGGSLNLVSLPMPEPMWDGERRLPGSYANFLILNGAVLVPVYGQPRDEQVLGILREVFPGRTVHGLDCRQALLEGGAVHCLSQQQPAGRHLGQ